MIPAAIGAVLLAWMLGVLGLSALWPRGRPRSADLPLIVPLGLGAGLGVTSGLFFAASLVAPQPLYLTLGAELLLATCLGAYLWRRRRSGEDHGPPAPDGGWISAILGSLFVQAGLLATVATTRAYQAEPYSASDGWTIWLMHARFLFRSGVDWPALLQAPQITWSHPDYPLLFPASVARAWAFAGHDAPFVAGMISVLFGVATVGLLVTAVMRLRHPAIAFAGGLVLLGTPFFVTFASNQHADIPLGFYILATVVLIALGRDPVHGGRFAVMAGATAGLAAWTKNEGLLFVVAAGAAWGLHEAARGSLRTIGAFLLGLLIALVPVLGFKLLLAPANDIVASKPWERWPDLLDGSRHRLILASLWRDVGRFGEWSVAPFVAMLLPLFGNGWRRLTRHEWLVAAVLGLMLMGFYTVYLLTHWDLRSHLDSSLVRLLLQLWPAALFFWCLAATGGVPRAELAARGGGSPRRKWSVLVIVNLGLASAALVATARQPVRNQLGGATVDGATLRVLMGEGWFGRETHEGDVWAWSRGESTLLLRLEAKQPRNGTLRFRIRSLGSRTVTARIGDRVVWRRPVTEQTEAVEITGLVLQPGTTAIVFQSDAPGVPESPAPGARALTFALYGPSVGK